MLDIENLVTELVSLNVRKELHGEELVLAVDVRLNILQDKCEKQFHALADDIIRRGAAAPPQGANDADDESTDETLGALSMVAASLNFAAEYENQRVSLRQGTRKLALCSHAKVNKFRLDDGEISFRIQAQVDHAAVGLLARALREHVAVDISAAQTELELPDANQE